MTNTAPLPSVEAGETNNTERDAMSGATIMAPDWTAQAYANGHDLVPDPPGSSMQDIVDAMKATPQRYGQACRWTCRSCGDAVLNAHADVVYGQAHDRKCEPSDTRYGWGDRTLPWAGRFPLGLAGSTRNEGDT